MEDNTNLPEIEGFKDTRSTSKKKEEEKPETKKPGQDEDEIYDDLLRIFKRLYNHLPDRAIGEAAYYIALIKLFPDTMDNISKYAIDLAGGKSKGFFREASYFLLEDGLLAQIITTLDFIKKQGYGKKKQKGIDRGEFGYELFLPVNPRVFFELNEDRISKIFSEDDFKSTKNRFIQFSQEFEKKLSITKLKKNNIGITLSYSGMWVTYTLADNITEGSKIYTLLSGARLSEDSQLAYYKKLLGKKIRINALFITKDVAKIKKIRESIPSLAVMNICIAPKECCYKTSRVTIVDNPFAPDDRSLVFALDGRKLLHVGKREPTYTGTLYLDDKYMKVIKDIFDTTWRNAKGLDSIEDSEQPRR